MTKNTQYLSFEIWIFYHCKNLKQITEVYSICSKYFNDILFAKFGWADQKIWILEDGYNFCLKWMKKKRYDTW